MSYKSWMYEMKLNENGNVAITVGNVPNNDLIEITQTDLRRMLHLFNLRWPKQKEEDGANV